MFSIFRRREAKPPVSTTASTALAINFSPPPTQFTPPILPAPVQPAPPAKRAKLVFAVDATSSREPAWVAAKHLTDNLLEALPGQLDVALAVHGGDRVHTFTPFTSNAGKLRDRAAGIRCEAGFTKLLDILARVAKIKGVSVVVYIGDTFEEDERWGRKFADILKKNGTRLIILHDDAARDFSGREIFADMAARTGGAVLPFDASALPRLRELIEAVAVLAVGDVPALTARQETMPAARLLLEHLSGKPRP